MQITLKTGKTVKLDWNWLVVERIEDEIGSFKELEGLSKKQIEKKIKDKRSTKLVGNIVYAIVQSNLDEEYSRNQLLRLIEMEDFEAIVDFMIANEEETKKVVDTKK